MTHDSSTVPSYDRPLAAVLQRWATTTPDAPGLFLPHDDAVPHKSWRDLTTDVWRMVVHLHRLGVDRDDRVVLWSDNR